MYNQQSPKSLEPRVIRVFVSSTFQDMHQEREELIKQIFPQLRKLCEKRGVTWGEVDLRWGVTDEQKAEGKVLPICLAEIHRCRPFFIALLGERYGWIPEEIPEDLIEREPWLEKHSNLSVTELEILHGVLNNPATADHAYFYFREPSYAQGSLKLQEVPSNEEIQRYGLDEAKRRAEGRRQMLVSLKDRIRSSGCKVREKYSDPKAFGRLVLEDLTEVIDRRHPADEEIDPLDRDAAEHEAFAASRTGVYVGREEHFRRLEIHAEADSPPLVVLGDSGSGKSALLANWAVRYRESHTDNLIVMHFIGASAQSTDWVAMLRRITAELKRRFNIGQEIPDEPDELRAAFANWLHMAAAKGRVVLILDALNQLEDRNGAPDLVWLPSTIPPNVRMVVSTLPGRPLEDLTKRGWPTMRIEPLEQQERVRLIVEYLEPYAKSLNEKQTEHISGARQTANPLYLTALLEELRLFGKHEEIDKQVEHYLAAPTVTRLFELILERYERDYERDRKGLVRDTMTLLWAARRGLSEPELLDLLGSGGEPLPGAYWSPLYIAAEKSLIDRSGLIGFSHDYLREAVRDRYLGTRKKQQDSHRELADYYQNQEIGKRKIEELPWQLAQAKSWAQLYNLLADLLFLEAAWEEERSAVKSYWTQVEENSSLRMLEAYRGVLDGRVSDLSSMRVVGTLFNDIGYIKQALAIWESLGRASRQSGDREGLIDALGRQGHIHLAQGDLTDAAALFNEQARICNEIDKNAVPLSGLEGRGRLLFEQGDLSQALNLFKQIEKICRSQNYDYGVQCAIGNQASVLASWGQLDRALSLHRKEEQICRRLGDMKALAASLGNQGPIHRIRGELDEALRCYKEQEAIDRQLGDKAGLARCLGKQGVVLGMQDQHEKAMSLYLESEKLCRELGDKSGLARSLRHQVGVAFVQGDLEQALVFCQESEKLYRDLGDKAGLESCLCNKGLTLLRLGDLTGAASVLKEAELLCRELGNKHELAIVLGNQAAILQNSGNLREAWCLYKEKENLCRELNDPEGLSRALSGQAVLLALQGSLREALQRLTEAHRIASLRKLTGLIRELEPLLSALKSRVKNSPDDPGHCSQSRKENINMVAKKAEDPKILGDVSKCIHCGKPAAGSVTVTQDNKKFIIILCEECISKIEREQSGGK